MKKSRVNNIAKIVIVNVLILAILLTAVEYGLRYHKKSKMVNGQNFVECDQDFFFIPHPVVGYYNIPGIYNCTLGKLNFRLTLLRDSTRFTGFTGFKENCESKQELYLFGCSFTWGHGLSDEETMAYLLQSRVGDCVHVKNYGIGAGSNVQSYLLLKSLIDRGEAPDIVIVNYASLHDERNAFKGTWRQMWQYMLVDNQINGSESDYGELKFPYAEIDKNDSLRFDYFPVYEIMNEIPKIDKSEILSRLDKLKIKEQIYAMDGQDITVSEKQKLSFRILKEMDKLCKSNGIKFMVTGIYPDEPTKQVLQLLDKEGIPNIFLGVDFMNGNEYNLRPIDEHPNAKANILFADRTYYYLNKMGFIDQ